MVGILPLHVGITTGTGGHKTGISIKKGNATKYLLFPYTLNAMKAW